MSNRHRPIAGKDRHIGGWKRDRPDFRDQHFVARVPDPASQRGLVPPSQDLSEWAPRIENQGEIGSCTANSSTSAMELLYRKQGRTPPELSRLFVYYFTRQVEGTPPSEDAGAQIRDVMRTLASMGAPREDTWPYVPHKFSETPPIQAVQEAVEHRVINYRRCYGPTPSSFLLAIKQAIAEGFPVVGGFSVYENMMSERCEKNGIVHPPTPDENMIGGHAILFAGYCDENASHAWIPPGHLAFINSWGTQWGHHGWGFLPFWYVYHGLVDDCWVIVSQQEFAA